MKRFLALLAVAVALGGVVLAIGVRRLLLAPWREYQASSVLLQIPAGSSSLSILRALEDGGVLRDRRLGTIALRTYYRGKTLKAGEYRFSGPLSPVDVLRPIVAGEVVRWKLTVPEGLTAEEIFSLFSDRGFGSEADFDRLFTEPRRFDAVPAAAPTLEGFLFPETYTLTRPSGAADVVNLMVREFRLRLPADFQDAAARRGLSLLEAVTLASLIEKETSVPDERPLVSAVFHNRLSRGMPLQCDPTTLYALKRLGKGRAPLSRADLSVDDPYNSYVRTGLPPGPICSPGLASLRAAVSPAASHALYFVAKGDGAHSFSDDYDGQQKNVARYRRIQRLSREARERGGS